MLADFCARSIKAAALSHITGLQKMAEVKITCELRQLVTCVSTRLASDESLWHFVSVQDLSMSPVSLERLLGHHDSVTVLDMSHCDNFEEKDFIKLWPLCKQLVKVSLAFCRINQDVLFALLSSCPNLRWLNLEGCESINHIPLPTVKDSSYYLIEHLNLAYCCNFTDLGCVTVGCIFGRRLRHLNIDGAQYITDAGLGAILNQCSVNQLEFLALDGAEITDTGIKKLQRFVHLKHLHISFCNKLTDLSLHYISTLVSLKQLYFKKGEQFTDEGLQYLFSCLGNLVCISSLECWEMDDKCLQVISSSCWQLKRLEVTWAKVTNTGVEHIVKQCHLLCELNLTGSYVITEQPFMSLLQVEHNNISLHLLNLTQCHLVSDRILHKFKDKIPNLKIIDFYGEIF